MASKIIIFRYILYGLMALEVILLPKILPLDLYAEIEYQKFLLNFAPFILLGSNSGYLYFRYKEKKDYFSILFFVGSFHLFIIGFFLYILFSFSILFCISFYLVGIVSILEQYLKVKKKFLKAIAVKPLISISILSITIFLFKFYKVYTVELVYYAIILGSIFWIALSIKDIALRCESNDIMFSTKYFLLIYKGFFINMGTLLIMAFFFSDRYFIKHFYFDYLPTYSFAYNISQFIILALTTIAYTNSVFLGESLEFFSEKKLKQEIAKTFKIYLFLLVWYIGFIYILNLFYNFKSLFAISLLLAIYLGLFYVFNSIGALLQYYDLQKKAFFLLLLIFSLSLFFSQIFIDLDMNIYIFLIKSAILLISYSLCMYVMIQKRVKNADI